MCKELSFKYGRMGSRKRNVRFRNEEVRRLADCAEYAKVVHMTDFAPMSTSTDPSVPVGYDDHKDEKLSVHAGSTLVTV